MIKNIVSIDEVIDFLNELLAVDADAVNTLVESRAPCNEAMADHPTVQVKTYSKNVFKMGILGVLNGIFGIDDEKGFGPIAMYLSDDTGKIEKFGRFKETD